MTNLSSITSIKSEVTELTERLEYLASQMGNKLATPSIKRGATHIARDLQALSAAALVLADKFEKSQMCDETDAADIISDAASSKADQARLLANTAAMMLSGCW